MKWFFIISISFISHFLHAQIPPAIFVESSSQLGVENKNGLLAKALVDLNGDFRDDILTMDKDSIYLEIQLNGGKQFDKLISFPVEKGPYTINVGDFNNDGLNDFLHSGFYDDVNIYHNLGNFDFEKKPPTGESIFAQGSSLFDIDNDGWLDAVITHDDAASIVLMNDRQGNLSKEDIIDFTTTPVSDNSGNYSAIWVDLNQDDQLDLYVAKCRVGATEPTDPRRVNMAFINEGGAFTEMAAEMNLAIGDQSWCTDSGDLDNDGDMDMILINHEAPHLLLENKGDGSFEHHDDFTNRGPFTTYDLEVAIQDFNNDGWQDILIGGTKDYLLINEGDLQFRRFDNPFGSKNASSFAIGDLNYDGYLDAYISFGGPDVPSIIADETWINFGGFYNHFKCTLQGDVSNAAGIGAKVELYGSWGKQVKWLNSGTAYGITNSLTLHFGLGEATGIDSLIINWPSGIIDSYYDLDINEHYTAVESRCLEKIIQLDYSKLELSCADDMIQFTNPDGDGLVFSNGLIDNQVDIKEEGLIHAVSQDSLCYNSSATYLITRIPELVNPELNYMDTIHLCEGDILLLESNLNTPVTWQDGSSESDYMVTQEGEYYLINSNECDTLFTESLFVEYTTFDFRDSIIVLDAVEDVTLFVDGAFVNWYSDASLNNLISQSNELQLIEVSSDTQLFFQVSGDRMVPSSFGGALLDSIAQEYSPENINATMLIDVLQPTIVESFEVETDSVGLRRFLILDGNDTIFTKDVNLTIGRNIIEFNVMLETGSYLITTDRDVNASSFGYLGPRIASHSASPVEYPFMVNNLLRINSSGFGNGFYYYLYNLKARPYFPECLSDVYSFTVMLDTTTQVSDIRLSADNIDVFPNPATDLLKISSKYDRIKGCSVFDLNGKLVLSYKNINSHRFDLNTIDLEPGMYVLSLQCDQGWIHKRFIKQ